MNGLLAIFVLPTLAGYILLTRSTILEIRSNWIHRAQLITESIIAGLFLLYLSYGFAHFVNGSFPKIDINWPFLSLMNKAKVNYHELQVFLDNPSENSFHKNIGILWDAFTRPIVGEFTNGLDAAGKHVERFKPTKESICTIPLAFLLLLLERILAKTKIYNVKVIKWRDELGGPLEQFLSHSMNNQTPVQITLKNRKVYVGLVASLPPLNTQNKFINIIPLHSGYRETESLAISKIMSDYNCLLKLLVDNINNVAEGKPINAGGGIIIDPKFLMQSVEMGIAIDSTEILSVGLWDNEVFKLFEREKKHLLSKTRKSVPLPYASAKPFRFRFF